MYFVLILMNYKICKILVQNAVLVGKSILVYIVINKNQISSLDLLLDRTNRI